MAHLPEGWLNFVGTVALTYRNYGSKCAGLFKSLGYVKKAYEYAYKAYELVELHFQGDKAYEIKCIKLLAKSDSAHDDIIKLIKVCEDCIDKVTNNIITSIDFRESIELIYVLGILYLKIDMFKYAKHTFETIINNFACLNKEERRIYVNEGIEVLCYYHLIFCELYETGKYNLEKAQKCYKISKNVSKEAQIAIIDLLANCYRQSGNIEEAIYYYELAIKKAIKELGYDSYHTKTLLDNYFSIIIESGKIKEIDGVDKQMLVSAMMQFAINRIDSFGLDHKYTQSQVSNFVHLCLMSRISSNELESICLAVVNYIRNQADDNRERLLYHLLNLGNVYAMNHNFTKAHNVIEEIERINEELFGTDTIYTDKCKGIELTCHMYGDETIMAKYNKTSAECLFMLINEVSLLSEKHKTIICYTYKETKE